jgi:hypothetical protein
MLRQLVRLSLILMVGLSFILGTAGMASADTGMASVTVSDAMSALDHTDARDPNLVADAQNGSADIPSDPSQGINLKVAVVSTVIVYTLPRVVVIEPS